LPVCCHDYASRRWWPKSLIGLPQINDVTWEIEDIEFLYCTSEIDCYRHITDVLFEEDAQRVYIFEVHKKEEL